MKRNRNKQIKGDRNKQITSNRNMQMFSFRSIQMNKRRKKESKRGREKTKPRNFVDHELSPFNYSFKKAFFHSSIPNGHLFSLNHFKCFCFVLPRNEYSSTFVNRRLKCQQSPESALVNLSQKEIGQVWILKGERKINFDKLRCF